MKCKQIYPNEKTYEIYIKYYCIIFRSFLSCRLNDMSKRKQFNPSPVTFLNNNFEREKGDYNFIILSKRMCIHNNIGSHDSSAPR